MNCGRTCYNGSVDLDHAVVVFYHGWIAIFSEPFFVVLL